MGVFTAALRCALDSAFELTDRTLFDLDIPDLESLRRMTAEEIGTGVKGMEVEWANRDSERGVQREVGRPIAREAGKLIVIRARSGKTRTSVCTYLKEWVSFLHKPAQAAALER